jgi:methylmalonyl-CoA/ethylmalonyl-CoA epimerase
MKNHIDHLGIIVRNLDDSIPFYTDILDLKVSHTETIEAEMIEVALIPGGDMKIELIQPLSNDSAAGKYLEKHGEGLHHICYKVPNIRQACEKCRKAGIRLLNEEPKKGANGTEYVFLDPKSTGRVLVELVQVPNHQIIGNRVGTKEILEVIKNGIGRYGPNNSGIEKK